jgi:hypothetical protein
MPVSVLGPGRGAAMILPVTVLLLVSPRPGRRIGYAMCMQPAAWPEPDPQIAAAIA